MLKLSILIPIYNNESTLKRSIDSVVTQLTDECELILLDDGSTDSSGAICDQYAINNDKIRVIHKENEGALLTRRKGMRESAGEYIFIPDGDDYIEPNAIERILWAINEFKTDLICFDFYRVGLNSKEKVHIPQLAGIKTDVPILTDMDYFKTEIVNGGNAGTLWLKVFKKSIIDLEEDYSHWGNKICVSNDLFQVLPIIDRAASAVYLPEPLYCYIKAENSLTTSVKPEKILSYYEVLKRREEYFKKWGIAKERVFGCAVKSLGSVALQISEGYKKMKFGGDKNAYKQVLNTVSDFDELKKIFVEIKDSNYPIPKKTKYILDFAFNKKHFLLNIFLWIIYIKEKH